MKCIFCDEELTDQTKPEHILLSCLGGRKVTRRADCFKHNEFFGSTIDREIAEQVHIIRHLLKLESGTGKSAPGLRNIRAGNRVINFDNEGKPKPVRQKPFTIEKRSDGSTDIEIKASDVEHLHKIIPNIAAALRISESDAKDLIRNGTARSVVEHVGTVHHRLSVGGENALRSIVKSALVLWTLMAGNDELRSELYEDARNFALSGGDFNVHRIKLDSRPIPGTDELTKRFGTFFNLLYVASDANGRVIAHFTLYNMIGWQIVIVEQGATANLRIGIINNPLEPDDWSDTIATDALIPFEWLEDPIYTDGFARARERLGNMLQKHVEDARDEEWEKIIRGVFERNGIEEGAALTDRKMINKVSQEIAHRITAHVFRIPYGEQLTPDQVAKWLDDQ